MDTEATQQARDQHIVLIDDDYATEVLAETLGFRGLSVRRFATASQAIREIDDVATADLVILDIIMERPEEVQESTGISGDRTTGMLILKALRQRNADIPVLVYSATSDVELIAALNDAPNTKFLSKWSTPSLNDFVKTVEHILGVNFDEPQPSSFIVHGHDETEKLALKNLLQNGLRLPEPTILHEQPNLGRTIIEKFEDYASMSDLAFVLLTPDDPSALAEAPDNEKRRARQNVIFELGYFLGVFGRTSGRVFLLHKGPLELPSDLSGVIYIDITTGVEAASENIRKEVQNVLRQ